MSIGLNVLGDRGISVEEVVNTASKLKAKYHTVMNSPIIASRLHGLNDAKVIYRIHAGDDGAHVHYSPEEFVMSRHAEAPPGTLLYLGNEPAPTQALADWTLEAMRVCDSINRKAVILNFSTGNPEPNDWFKFQPALLYAHDKGHKLGLHEYLDGNWLKDYPYHVGRFLALTNRFKFTPEIVITEIGAAMGYKPDRGYRWANSLTDEQFARELITADQQVYNPRNIHVTIFAYTRDHEDDDWHTFHPRARVIEILSGYTPESNPVATIPIPVTAGVRATLTKIPDDYVNVRDQPITGKDVGDARVGDKGIIYPLDTINGWIYFKADNGTEGWVSLQSGAVVFTQDTPEPPAKPTLDEMLNTLVSLVVAQVANIREVYGDRNSIFEIIYPVDDPVITQVFGARPEYYSQFGLPGHEGIDYGGAIGKPVRAVARGTVTQIFPDNKVHPYGNHIRISHIHGNDTYETVYAHLSEINTRVNDTVLPGQVIGKLGNTGNATGPHLHFTLKKNGAVVNPESYFKGTK